MTINPKLEFYRFSLNHKDEKTKTFQQFAIDELNNKVHISESETTKFCFDHFIKSLSSDFAKDDKLKKQIALNVDDKVNIFLHKRPTFKSESNVIYGVINGGHFGKDGIVSETSDPKKSSKLDRSKSVLSYYFFLIYLPSNHHEGCFAVHSNSREDSITDIMRSYISKLFRGLEYNASNCKSFCPKSFQEKFKNEAVLKSMKFKQTYLENIQSVSGIKNDEIEFTVKIEIIPKKKSILFSKAKELRQLLIPKVFGDKNSPIELNEFDASFEAESNNSSKSFEFNTQDNDFIPIINLKKKITKRNADGTPDFGELEELCFGFFYDEVLPELRPDLYVNSVV